MAASGGAVGKGPMQAVVLNTISVVIASHRPGYIAGCLDGLIGTATTECAAEIIVVADYPVEHLAKEYPGVQWIYMADTSISAKRNNGIVRCGGSIVGFTDDDCIPCAGWIENADAFLRIHDECAGVAGQTIVQRVETASYPLREFKRLELRGWRTNNIFYRKRDLVDVGRFDERFTVQREDVDLAFSILAKGRNIGYCSDSKVVHRHRNNEYWDLLKNCRNRRFDPLLYKKHKSAYRKTIGSPLPPGISLMLTLHLVVAVLWCAENPRIACAAAVGSVGYGMFLSVRRNGFTLKKFGQIVRDTVSYFISPYVLVAALLYGNVKFRSFLLF